MGVVGEVVFDVKCVGVVVEVVVGGGIDFDLFGDVGGGL